MLFTKTQINVSLLLIVASIALISCASTPKLAVNPLSVTSEKQYDADYESCLEIAKTYDLSGETAVKTVAGAAAGGIAVAGVATAVAGAVFAPAIPFIIAGSLAGGGLWGSNTSKEEAMAREKILVQCMRDRGYEVYSPR